MTRLFWIAIAGAAVALAGCSAGPSPSTVSPETTVFQAKLGYSAALGIAVRYNALPRCAPAAPVVCSDQSVVLQLRKADAVAGAALDAAESTVRMPGVNSSLALAAAKSAVESVKVLQTVISVYGIK